MNTTDSEFDLIVVGYGDAGAAAAIEAAENGARVLVLDRAYGGGASALSGGVVYAGGGTSYQQQEGYEDTVENLYTYLKMEAGDAVDDATLRRFCEQSPGTIDWLEERGARFRGGVPPYKTSYPTDDYYLYHSGNEMAHPYKDHAEPVPRGHRTLAPGLGSGKALWTALARHAQRIGVTFVPVARVHDLIIEGGEIAGVRYRVLPEGSEMFERHRKLSGAKIGKLANWFPAAGEKVGGKADQLFETGAVEAEARARAIVLAAGGFVYNRDWVQKYIPEFADISPLGTPGDDGTGIRLGMDAGGAVDKMNNATAWRFLSPPSGLLEGVAVGMDGTRIAAEDQYGATFSDHMVREHDAKGWAFYDTPGWVKARAQVGAQAQIFTKLQMWPLFAVGHKKANTLEELARKTGVDAARLRETVDAYNEGIRSGDGDPAHKSAAYCAPVLQGPFYAIDISVKNAPYFPAPGLTLGGLKVDGGTGQVQREDGTAIEGLYAAGRNAVGVCSNSYVSGLSLADCIFSGRRAGAHAAREFHVE